MHFLKSLCLVVLLAVFDVNAFPQSASEIARGTKLTEQSYYNSGVKFCGSFKSFNDIEKENNFRRQI